MSDNTMQLELDEKNLITMKLLHYFITEKNYNPIILQGADNEIWLENMDENYKIVRIVTNYIHNDEQFDFDMFKTKRIVKKIKKKTLSFNINTLSIFLDLGENVELKSEKRVDCIKVSDEEDLNRNTIVKDIFPDLTKKMEYTEEGFELFMRITNDINSHNKTDQEKVDEVFKMKYPIVTYILIGINLFIYIFPKLLGTYDRFIDEFCIYGPLIKAGEYYRLISGIFLHGSIIHLLVNCYSLYVVGTQLESFLGKTKFLIVYLFSGLTGSLFSVIFTHGASVGASGAIFGLLGSLVYFGYHYRVYLGNVIKSQIIPLIILNLGIGFMFSGIDNFAHIGGLIGGTLITIGLGVRYKSSTFEKINGIIISLVFLAFCIYMALFYKTI